MSADLFDDRVIEMAGIAQEVASDVVGMFDAGKDIVGSHGELGALPKLGAGALALEVDVVHPSVVVVRRGRGDVLLEDDDVAVRHDLRVRGREDGSSTLMDSLGAERRGRRSQQRQEGQADEGTHGG